MVPVDQVFLKFFPYYVISFVAVVNGLFISSNCCLYIYLKAMNFSLLILYQY